MFIPSCLHKWGTKKQKCLLQPRKSLQFNTGGHRLARVVSRWATPNSPDLKPIEHLWDVLEKQVWFMEAPPHILQNRYHSTSVECMSGLGNLHNIRQMLIMLCLIGIHIRSSSTFYRLFYSAVLGGWSLSYPTASTYNTKSKLHILPLVYSGVCPATFFSMWIAQFWKCWLSLVSKVMTQALQKKKSTTSYP